MSNLDAMAGIREGARKNGGEAMVKLVDKAAVRERELCRKIEALVEETMSYSTDDEERKFYAVAVNEALSEAYAKAALAYGKVSGQSDNRIIVLAMRSMTTNFQIAIEDRGAKEGNIINLITAARGAK